MSKDWLEVIKKFKIFLKFKRMNEQRRTPLNFDKVSSFLKDITTFAEARQTSRDYFSKIFLDSPDSNKSFFSNDIFRWSTNKLHSRQPDDRLAALVGFSFYVDIDDDQSNLFNIVQSLERILPTEVVIIIEGIARLVKWIARRIPSPIVPHLFDRSVSWLSFVRDTRATTSAVISSLFLFLRLCSFDPLFYKRYSSELNNIMMTALTFPNEEIQQAVVDLSRKITESDPAANEYVSTLITNILYSFGNNDSVTNQPKGYFLLFSSFLVDNKDVCADKADDLFPKLSDFMAKYPTEENLPFLAELCETLPLEAEKFSDRVFKIFLNSSKINFNNTSICHTFARIARKLPSHLCGFANDISFSLIPQSTDCFFILIKVVIECQPKLVDRRFVLGVFDTAKWTSYVADASISFASTYSSDTFKFIHIFTKKLNYINEISLSFLSRISFLDQFPLMNYWDMTYDAFYSSSTEKSIKNYDNGYYNKKSKDQYNDQNEINDNNESNKKLKVALVYTLTSIIKRFRQEDQSQKIFSLLTHVIEEDSAVQSAFLDSIDDSLLPHFAVPSNFCIIQQLYESDDYSVTVTALLLIEKVRKMSPISTLNFFYTQLGHFPNIFYQIPSKDDQMKFIEMLPLLISCSGDFVISHSQTLLNFLLQVLNNRLSSTMSPSDSVRELYNIRCDRQIRIHAMHCMSSLAGSNGCDSNLIPDVINALVDQLLLFRSKKVQLAATQTLRVLFRTYPMLKTMSSKATVKLHQSLFSFLKTSQNTKVNQEMLKLFGTIGSLDPYEFHTPHSQMVTEDVYPLYDRAKREQSYLNFVMKYILGQLKDTSKTHDLFVLINAVVYIFQSDASKCLDFLEEVVFIFTTILDRPNAQIRPGELFPSFKTIVLVVDIEILPHADAIYRLVLPYITEKHDLDALKLLNALIFSLKTNFVLYGSSTFAFIVSLLDEEQSGTDTEVTLMLTLTLLVIFAGGSIQIFFDHIYKRALANVPYSSPFSVIFLAQALRSAPLKELVIPSLRLALTLIEKSEHCREPAIHLIELLVIRFPDIMTNLPLEPQLKELVQNISTDSQYKANTFTFLQTYDPVPDQHTILSMPVMSLLPLSQIFGRGRLQSSVSENDWSAWLLQLTQELVLCSNSPAIRASHPLLRLSPEFEAALFPFVIVSVWDIALESDRNTLSNYLLGIVHNLQTPPDILSVIVAACDAMDRANFALFKDPFVSGQIAERCNSWFRALRFFEKALSKTIEPTSHLLQIHSLLKRKESALGLLNIAVSADSNCELLEALSMWSQARDVYEKKFNENSRNETFLAGYLNCSMFLEDWGSIEKRVNEFSTYTRDMQPKVAVIFAAAMRNTGSDSSMFLRTIKTDDPVSCTWRAIYALDKNNLEAADKWTSRGLSLLGKDMSPFASGSYEPSIPTICSAMMLEELRDITDQRRGSKTADQILHMWNSKADYVKRDASQLRSVYRVRELLQCSKEQLFIIHLDFVDSLRKLKEWTLFDNSFRRLFEGVNDERVKLMRAKFLFDRGISNDLTEIKNIIEKLKRNPGKTNVYCDAILSYVSRSPISPEVIPLLNIVIELQPKRVRAWKHWAYFNLGCAQPSGYGIMMDESCATFASNAMKGFAMLIKLTGPSLHFLCQLCALFFTYGPRLSNFSSGAENLTSLEPSSVIQIIPQLMVQFDHPNESVRKIVYNIVRVFAEDHFQALSMPLCLVKRTPTSSKALLDFIDQMGHEHRELMSDAETFTAGMLQIAVTAVEEVIVLLEKAIALADGDAVEEEVTAVFTRIHDIIINASHRSFVQSIFADSKIMNFVKRLDKIVATPTEICHLGNAAASTKTFLQMKMDTVTAIDIAEMDFMLCNASSFSLAVPGFYSVDREPVTIASICHVMKLIPSAKRPRKLRIRGSDGRSYKYLLKGREDLRLDQRVMQLFSLTNSILHDDKFGVERHLHIKQVPIVPIAPNAGLIAWAEGGETIYSMISWHRRIVGIDNNEEQVHLKNYIGDDSTIAGDKESTLRLSAIQKLELHRELCQLALDDDIRETMWLRSPNAELWLNQTTNFARSNGLMSIIGYLIGIGDRHPSNILVMKGTGNVVHIDFSDVFEKASLRAYVHETVPFRLTRMLVRALGASGIHGVFEMTAEYVMTLMRRNKETLLAFLDIFIQDPITDTLWYRSTIEGEEGSTLKKAIARVSDKLNGREFDRGQLNEHEQVIKLIEAATSEMNLAQMYYGWAPFW